MIEFRLFSFFFAKFFPIVEKKPLKKFSFNSSIPCLLFSFFHSQLTEKTKENFSRLFLSSPVDKYYVFFVFDELNVLLLFILFFVIISAFAGLPC